MPAASHFWGTGAVLETEAYFGHTFRIRQYRRHDRVKSAPSWLEVHITVPQTVNVKKHLARDYRILRRNIRLVFL